MDIKKDAIIAVVGVSSDSDKYGNKVFFNLLDKNFDVMAVHPDGGSVSGYRRYRKLSELPRTPDVVVLVVKPEVGLKIVEECAQIGIKKLWMQPGSESQEAIELCKKKNIEVVSSDCIMVKTS
jgi:predicted CoA-binding protein